LFAPEIASTAAYELNSAFTPDGREMYQTIVVEGWGFSAIIRRQEGTEGWENPTIPSFSGCYNDIDPNLSPDGTQVIFASRRPEDPAASKELSSSWDLWIASRKDVSSPWGHAQRLPEPVNSTAVDIYPSISASGTIYFSSNREGGHGKLDVYRVRPDETGYRLVENLGPRINSEHHEGDAFIAPDESYLIIAIDGRPDSHGQSDLYMSFVQEDGEWGELHHMGGSVNTPEKEFCPVVTPDGRFFFFTRGRMKGGNLHSDQQKTFHELAEKIYTWRNHLPNIYWVNNTVLKREAYE
jgi:Tol biopolymer transport system component